ncbi:pirin family protein [Bordetella holmesii]|uniref:Pirin family protein n=2 Tax=Bordetella holmesii TaxID=35814 RepID=A0A158M6Q2_9BORD|nr:pirin family protein [Bordetella holmesii]AHV91507.1 pirin family protein [Bordetella holmesii ATCC 51541]AIT28259.1 pirin family protein [Bordetella holmesii 44057]EWM41047.1 pirin family protein [Bordetella holmesii 35009]EWM43494.1 pirin family protein [Bordetella holmesii 41130]EWM44937.1 pirin family protein [Bordetella holmesii 70147]
MSNLPPRGETSLDTIVVPRSSDLGGFEVRRALPSAQRRSIGPFVFLDEMGPAIFPAGTGMDVRPHPHIGLGTVTYLYDGSIVHRDGKGHVQTILPGEVNWMTAGRGIVHSERSSPESRRAEQRIFGLQLWVGLTRACEETDPGFAHYGRQAQPVVEGEGVRAQVVAGSLFGQTSQVNTLSPLFFGDVQMQAGACMELPAEYDERGAYLVQGRVEVDGQVFEAGRLLVFKEGCPILIRAHTDARFAVLGGQALDGPRFIWWNFVSSSKERIEQAKDEWQRNRFGQIVPGDETEFIPLPVPRG